MQAVHADAVTYEVNKDLEADLRDLKAHFPNIGRGILARTVVHHLAPHELPKLLDANADSTKSLAEAVPTPEALVPLLRLYFDILTKACHLRTIDVKPEHFESYIAQLSGFARGHAWGAVMEYHLAFHGKRLAGMASASAVGGGGAKVTEACAAWAVVDPELCARCLQPQPAQDGRENELRTVRTKASQSNLFLDILSWVFTYYLLRGVYWSFFGSSSVNGKLGELESEVTSMKALIRNQTREIGFLESENDLLKTEADVLQKTIGTSLRMLLDWLSRAQK